MALSVVWSQPALDDLDDILAFIAMDKPMTAKRLGRRSIEATRKLARFPSLGRVVPELAPSVYRELLLRPIRIIYRRESNKILIVHVVRQEELLAP